MRLVVRFKRDGTTGPPQPGDLGEARAPVVVGTQGVEIVIDRARSASREG